MSNKENTSIKPKTIDKLRFAADSAFAMLAGMQLDVFTPLKGGPKTADQIGEAIGVAPDRLRLLLYALVSAGLLDVQNGFFANTGEASHFLVQGKPEYLGNIHPRLADHWSEVTAITRKVVNEEGLGNRVAIVTADVLTSPLPGSYDAAVLKNFLQVLSPTDVRRALVSVSQAIKPGGTGPGFFAVSGKFV